MKAKELRDLNTEELLQKEKTFKKELFDLSTQRKFGGVEKPSQFKTIKKSIARILTIIKERETEDGKNS
ncbi:MAG: large subunit ribosomal protein L29 [Lysobacterales bacterium]|jgi:large subunit ribosomal protein L29